MPEVVSSVKCGVNTGKVTRRRPRRGELMRKRKKDQNMVLRINNASEMPPIILPGKKFIIVLIPLWRLSMHVVISFYSPLR